MPTEYYEMQQNGQFLVHRDIRTELAGLERNVRGDIDRARAIYIKTINSAQNLNHLHVVYKELTVSVNSDMFTARQLNELFYLIMSKVGEFTQHERI